MRLKLSCNERSNLRTSIGISGDGKAETAEHHITPEVLNGWPLFKRSNPGTVPIAGPNMDKPIELGIDVSELFVRLAKDKDGKGRFFLRFGRAKKSKAKGQLHACALRYYDSKGKLIREMPIDVKGGKFGENDLVILTDISLDSKVLPEADQGTKELYERSDPEPTEAQRPLFKFLRVQDAWKELGDSPGCRVWFVSPMS